MTQSERSFRLTGLISLKAPIAISLHSQRAASSSDPTPVPATTVWDPVQQALLETAFIPSTSIRGALRRAARDALFELLHPNGESGWDLDTLYLQTIGGIYESGAGGDAIMLDVTRSIEERERNPLVGLFGASNTGKATFLAGALELSHAIPSPALDPARCPTYALMRSDDMLRSPVDTMTKLDEAGPEAWNTRFGMIRETSALKARKREINTAMSKAIKAKDQETVEALKKEREDIEGAIKGGKMSIAMPVAGYKALPQGLETPHEMRLTRTNLEQLGLFLEALDRFSLSPMIGGQRARGCGEIALAYDLGEIGGEAIGRIEVGGFAPARFPHHPLIEEARKAFKAGAKRYDVRYGEAATVEKA